MAVEAVGKGSTPAGGIADMVDTAEDKEDKEDKENSQADFHILDMMDSHKDIPAPALAEVGTMAVVAVAVDILASALVEILAVSEVAMAGMMVYSLYTPAERAVHPRDGRLTNQ